MRLLKIFATTLCVLFFHEETWTIFTKCQYFKTTTKQQQQKNNNKKTVSGEQVGYTIQFISKPLTPRVSSTWEKRHLLELLMGG